MKTLTTVLCLLGVSIMPSFMAPPAAFAQRETARQRQPDQIRNRNQGSISWSGHVDQTMDVSFQQGRSWNKRISGREGSGSAVFSMSIPRRSVRMTVNQSLGRGRVTIEEQPTRSNGYTCVVRVADRRSGGDKYKFTLTWDN
jgi:hypothetical protein